LVEIELWSRPTPEARAAASSRIRALVTAAGGTVKAETVIEKIRYHGNRSGPLESWIIPIGSEFVIDARSENVIYVRRWKPNSA
jgi:hypothetical protein